MTKDTIKVVSIDDLTPDGDNANKDTPRGKGMVARSLGELGAGRSVLVDADLETIAGNKTVAQAKAQGITEVVIVPSDGSRLVAVQRVDLDLDSQDANQAARARRMAYLDNRANEVGLAWDMAQVAADLAAGLDLAGIFTQAELDSKLASEGAAAGKGELEISPELLERHDYLVFYFDNQLDWQAICEMFGVHTVQSAKVGNRTVKPRGLGRLLPGKVLLQRLGL